VSLDDFPRYPLLFGPSPVHRLERLTVHLGGPGIWAKREDCNSGLAYGGNKTRKLEYLVPDVLAQGADTLVSIGGVQSNHTRQVAAVAAKLGLKARLVQENWVDWPDSVNDRVGNILLSRIMGADVRLVDEGFGIGIKSSWEQALEDVRAAGGRPEGMIIDPVYEGKSMAGLIDLVRTGRIGSDSTVLYAHLGGQPALNAYSALFR
jgi:1-aminocyclopropane-1-carboxylate deaminase